MFNPASFKAHRESIVIGNSEHPVQQYVTGLLARPVPGRDDLWYIRTTTDDVTITYRPRDRSLCFYELSFAEFKAAVVAKTLPNVDVVDLPDTDKYIGNAIFRELNDRAEYRQSIGL